mmetsp:Transcript_15927/g.40430  ORF Transcript_15927/g.40430 Transcript_15927/m.40430 type:complete len:268 (-) Transcript_15927:332-1135(-)
MRVASETRSRPTPHMAALYIERTGTDIELPTEFICPITQAKMRDPVVAADGISYERDAIVEWLRSCRTSPMMQAPLEHLQLNLNINLRKRIQEYEVEAFERAEATYSLIRREYSEQRRRAREDPPSREPQQAAREEAQGEAESRTSPRRPAGSPAAFASLTSPVAPRAAAIDAEARANELTRQLGVAQGTLARERRKVRCFGVSLLALVCAVVALAAALALQPGIALAAAPHAARVDVQLEAIVAGGCADAVAEDAAVDVAMVIDEL